MEKIAFALGGGSIKGIHQMGAINNCLERGFHPDLLTGISVGTMNANLLVNKVGQHYTNHPNKPVNWQEVSDYLKEFWLQNITCPEDIAKKKGILKILWEVVRGKFNSFSDTAPLRKLIEKTIEVRYLKQSGLKLSCGCVNLEEGKILYTNTDMQNYLQYILASTVIPFMMPVEEIGSLKFVDGGLVDSAPVGQAIKMGATKVIVIANHPERVGHRAINHNNPMEYADRLMEIIVNNTLNNDLMEAQLINEMLKKDIKCSRTEGKKIVDIHVIRPQNTLDLKIDNFTSADIKRLWQMGYDEASRVKL